MSNAPSIIDLAKDFATEAQCLDYLEAARWPNGIRCVICGGERISKFVTNETTRVRVNRKGKEVTVRVPSRRLYTCLDSKCGFQFSATAGTLFHDSHLPLSKWFMAVALICNAKKGLSAKQMQRDVGVNYRTAWYLNHRIREAMQGNAPKLFSGTVEVDATFIGGKYNPRLKRQRYDKQAVAGVLQRPIGDAPSKIRAILIRREIGPVMQGVIRENVALEATIMTDEHAAYKRVARTHRHEIVAHTKGEYVRGGVHTQGIESFWSLFKRGVIGSFHQVSIKHLHRYLNEFSFRFNGRAERNLFGLVIANLLIGAALQYKALTGRPQTEVSVSDVPRDFDAPF